MPIPSEEHTVKRYDQELEQLRRHVMQMGGLVEEQIQQAVHALYEEDVALAQNVVGRDRQVNAMEVSIDEQVANLIALRQPMASDLRLIMALSKTVTDLERIGDEAERVARTTVRLYDKATSAPQPRLLRDVLAMSRLASAMLNGSLDALARLDVEKAASIQHGDSELDDAFGDALRRLVTYMMEDPRTIGHATDMLFLIKGLERIGDHAKNIAEYVIYLVKGKDVRHMDISALKGSHLLRND